MRTNSRKKTTVILSSILVVVIAIGLTLAFLATKTDEVSNVFTFAENIRARIDEPNWNKDDAKNLIPGYEVKKDPMITNLSGNGVDEYAAIKVTFTDGTGTKLSDGDTLKLLNMLDITWNNSWTLKSGTLTTAAGKVTAATAEQIYVHNNVLTPGAVSDPVFSSVTIKGDISEEDYAWLAGIVMDHTEDCYTFGAHDDAKCHITYKHHVNCAVYGIAGAEEIKKGGTIGVKTCDCNPAEQHEATCPSLNGTLKGTCNHTVANAISGFRINVQGAAVQAGVEENATLLLATANLIALFQ